MVSLYNDYKKFERIVKRYDGSGIIDLSTQKFLAPTTLIPLLCFITKNEIDEILVNNSIEEYIVRILNKKKTNTTTPYTELPNTNEERQKEEIALNMAKTLNEKYGGLRTLYHIYDELISNVYDHTPFELGYENQWYTYAQEYPRIKKLDICVMDDGLSIPGKFERKGINFVDDCDAISKAINQVSTENDGGTLDKYSRGFGLWSTIKLVVEGNGGSALFVSRNGCLEIINKKRYKYHHLNNNYIFKGTLVSFKLNKCQVQDYYGLIEKDTSKDYLYGGR